MAVIVRSTRYSFGKIALYSLGGLFSVLLLGALALSVWIWAERAQNAEMQEISAQDSINQINAPMINGVRQWVQIRGHHKENPVILFIHGGPGNAMMPMSGLFQPLWERDFTVAQWDQRGAGKSKNDPVTGNPNHAGTTIQQYIDDAVAVSKYILEQTGQEKLIVVGHSWGSVVGSGLAQQRPDLLHAYVGTGQVVDMLKAEEKTYQLAMAEARDTGNIEAIDGLESLGNFPESLVTEKDDLRFLHSFATSRRLSNSLLPGGRKPDESVLAAIITNPVYSIAEAIGFIRDITNFSDPSTAKMMRVLIGSDLTQQLDTFQVPVVFLEGRHDHVTVSTLIYEKFKEISAPYKSFHWLEQSGHLSMIQEPERFADLLVEHVRPLALTDIR